MEEILLPAHLLGLAIAFVGVLLADHAGFSWMRGKTPLLDGAKLKKYHHIVSIGLGLLIVSGLVLFWPGRNFLIHNTLFLGKMTCVLALVINGFVISKFMGITTTRTFASLSTKEKTPLMISGAVSTLGWIGSLTFALILFS